MSDGAIRIVLALASVLVAPRLWSAVRDARRRGDVDASTVLVFGTAWLVTAPIALAALTGGYQLGTDVSDEPVVTLPAWYPQGVQVAMAAVIVLAIAVLAQRVLHDPSPVLHLAPLLAIVLWCVAQLSAGLQGRSMYSDRALVLLVCLAAATVLPRGRGAAVGAAVYGVTLALASGLFLLWRPEDALHDCTGTSVNQCSVFGSPVAGVLTNQNLFGVVLAVSIAFVYIGLRGRVRWPLIAYLLLMAIATGSRTAGIGALVICASLSLVRPRLDRRVGFARTATAVVLLAVALVASVYLPRGDWALDELTGRPQLWSTASDYIDRAPWFGYGPNTWASLYDRGEIPQAAQRSTHNQWLDVLFVSGRVGLVLFVFVLGAMLASAPRSRAAILVAFAAILIVGTTEGAWAVGAIDGMSFSFIALLLTGDAIDRAPERSPRRAPPVVAGRHAMS